MNAAGWARELVHVIPSTAWGGAEQVAATLDQLARKNNWSSSLDYAGPGGEFPGRSFLCWALAERSPGALLHAHLPWPDRLGPALVAARGRPLVVTFHLLPEAGRWPRDRLVPLPAEQVLRLAGRRRGRVRWVALTADDCRTLEALLRAEVRVVRNAPPAPAPTTSPVLWPAGATRLLSVGRLEWQKGFDRMLRALADPRVRALPWHWILLGDGADRRALESHAEALGLAGRVSFLGTRPAADGYARAELVLSPSRREGFALVPLEALEAGVPVLASRIPCHTELFAATPGALLPADPTAWPSRVAELVLDAGLRAALALAQRSVLGNNPREHMWTAYASLYRELAP